MSIDNCIQCNTPLHDFEKPYKGYCHVCMAYKLDLDHVKSLETQLSQLREWAEAVCSQLKYYKASCEIDGSEIALAHSESIKKLFTQARSLGIGGEE